MHTTTIDVICKKIFEKIRDEKEYEKIISFIYPKEWIPIFAVYKKYHIMEINFSYNFMILYHWKNQILRLLKISISDITPINSVYTYPNSSIIIREERKSKKSIKQFIHNYKFNIIHKLKLIEVMIKKKVLCERSEDFIKTYYEKPNYKYEPKDSFLDIKLSAQFYDDGINIFMGNSSNDFYKIYDNIKTIGDLKRNEYLKEYFPICFDTMEMELNNPGFIKDELKYHRLKMTI